jgi:hypothetical protein
MPGVSPPFWMVNIRIGATMRSSAKQKRGQKPVRSQSVCPEQTTPAPLNDTAGSDRSFDFLIHQLEYVTLFRTETFKRLSLVLAFSSFIFFLLVSEAIYAQKNALYDNFIIAITVAAFFIFTVIWLLTIYLLSPIVIDKTSLMIPSGILGLRKEQYEAEVNSKAVEDYKCILIREIYAVSRAEKRRSRILDWLLRALTILYILVIVNSVMIAYVQNTLNLNNP